MHIKLDSITVLLACVALSTNACFQITIRNRTPREYPHIRRTSKGNEYILISAVDRADAFILQFMNKRKNAIYA